jgi:BCD family chlorophyll transporter-like MFS transporter
MTTSTLEEQPVTQSAEFSLSQTLRLSSFQIGSAMVEILTASVWNRIVITELGKPATFVSLLLALQYILLPISLWAGNRSDTTYVGGRKRTPYIWTGRIIVLGSLPLLWFSLTPLSEGNDALGWAIAFGALLLFGAGKLLSGSVFLALVRDVTPPRKQGLALSMVETTLIMFFPITAIVYGRWMEAYSPAVFQQMVIGTMLIAGFFWWFAIYRAEPKAVQQVAATPRRPLWPTFKKMWADSRARSFFAFLALATFAAWMQDSILEPFGGDVLGLSAGDTTRFTAYWGTATVVVLIVCFVVWRNRPPETLTRATRIGLIIMAFGMLLLAVTASAENESLLIPSLLVFGSGFGLYTFGGFSLMTVMSPSTAAGAYLGLWTIAILLFKGFGTFLGGVLRDLFFLVAGLPAGTAYAIVFVVAAVGLVGATALVRKDDILSFASEHGRTLNETV